ncbi:MAG TPA: amidase [Roseiarcus sp.]|jgi:amidase|nr:amidase [Roseiarcus sp.]
MTTTTRDIVNLYAESDALGLAELVQQKEVTPSELAEVAIGLIEKLDPKLNAVVIRDFDRARAMAALPQNDGTFAGVPYLLKNIGSGCEGLPLTNSLPYLKDYVSPSDSEMVRRIKASGLNILGRTNVPEQGWCIATEPRMYGPTINPWNPGVTAGGSSGGAASAVASRMIPMAEASDGGGSIRAPASCCAVVGLKPSRGRITYGPDDVDVWFGSVSIFAVTRTARDSAAFLDVAAGNMLGDPYMPPRPATSWLESLQTAPKALRIGCALASPWGPAFAPEVRQAVEATISIFEDMGHSVEEHAFVTNLEQAWRDYNQMTSVQTVLEFEAMAKVVGRPVRRSELIAFNWSWLEHGRSLSARDYAASIAAIRKANQQIQTELTPYDVFLTPTLTQLPRPVGYWDMNEPDFDKYIGMWTDAAFLFAFNLSGLPAMSVPTAWTEENVPIGVQLVGRYGDEAKILQLAAQLEQVRPWIQRRPSICALAS